MNQGQGYGNAWLGDIHNAKLGSTLRDMRTGHGRTYAALTGYGQYPQFTLQSGRRADGGSTYATMATKTYSSSGSLRGYRAAR